MIGHDGHPEVEGTMGQTDEGMYSGGNRGRRGKAAVSKPDQLAYVSQTTLSVDDTADIIDALGASSRPSSNRRRAISATPPPTARKP
jgi:4-hydroxy-3-methylbut-2-enyl diphosphate reductase